MVVGIDDGQTNGKNFIPFVCPSRGVVVVGIDDGQTNGILLFWGGTTPMKCTRKYSPSDTILSELHYNLSPPPIPSTH